MGNAMETVNVKLDTDTRDELTKLAKSNERTFAAEVRIAIREHLRTATERTHKP